MKSLTNFSLECTMYDKCEWLYCMYLVRNSLIMIINSIESTHSFGTNGRQRNLVVMKFNVDMVVKIIKVNIRHKSTA